MRYLGAWVLCCSARAAADGDVRDGLAWGAEPAAVLALLNCEGMPLWVTFRDVAQVRPCTGAVAEHWSGGLAL